MRYFFDKISLLIGAFLGLPYMIIRLIIFCIDITQAACEDANGPYAVPKFRISKLNEKETAQMADTKKHMEEVLNPLSDNEEIWGGDVLATFNYEKTAEALSIFMRNIKECNAIKLSACLWVSDSLLANKVGHPVSGLIYCKTEQGFIPKEFEKLLEIPVFLSRQRKVGYQTETVYYPAKRVGTQHLSMTELQTIAETIDKLKDCDEARFMSYIKGSEYGCLV